MKMKWVRSTVSVTDFEKSKFMNGSNLVLYLAMSCNKLWVYCSWSCYLVTLLSLFYGVYTTRLSHSEVFEISFVLRNKNSSVYIQGSNTWYSNYNLHWLRLFLRLLAYITQLYSTGVCGHIRLQDFRSLSLPGPNYCSILSPNGCIHIFYTHHSQNYIGCGDYRQTSFLQAPYAPLC